MVGRMLTRKLGRDIRQTAGQFAAVTAVVACAMVVFVSLRLAYGSLVWTRDSYYERHHFADFFVHLEKAPESALREVESIPGVWRVRGRIVKDVPLKVRGNDGAVVGRIISMPDRRDDLINDIYISSGSYFPGAAATEVIVSDRFCEANGLRVGDSIEATINERREALRIVGTAFSPEYVYALAGPQQFAPNDRDFAVIFARKTFVEDAFNMTNAVNDITGLLRPGADVEAVLDQVKKRLDQYGVYRKYGRDQQLSNQYLSYELMQLRNSALVTPMIFLVVAAAVIHVLLRRMTELQRMQIGLLCALGISKARITAHYVHYAVAVAVAGSALGALLGCWLAARWVDMYNLFFRFPSLQTRFSAPALLHGFLLCTGMCALGAAQSAWAILHVQPAVAMRPPLASARLVRRSAFAFLYARLPLVWRLSVRNSVRAWRRSVFTIIGVALATIIMLIGSAVTDWLDFIIHYQFDLVDRSDMNVGFTVERPAASVTELQKVDGVRRAEGIFQFGAELRHGWRKKTVLVMGLPADGDLYRVYDAHGRRVTMPEDGLVVPTRLARLLDLRPGDSLAMEPYLKDRRERPAVVRAVADQYIGLTVYAGQDLLGKMLDEARVVNGALLQCDSVDLQPVVRRLNDIPGVSTVSTTRAVFGEFQETVTELMRVTTFVLALFAAIIAFAVIYNSSSVSIAEQERDLATMCSLGFERESVAQVATNDIMPLGLVGVAVGLPLGVQLCHLMAQLYETDLYRLPVVIRPTTYALVVAAVLAFQWTARWVCRRRVYRIDILRTLKSRE